MCIFTWIYVLPREYLLSFTYIGKNIYKCLKKILNSKSYINLQDTYFMKVSAQNYDVQSHTK